MALSIVNRPVQNKQEVFVNARYDFERDTIDAELHICAICAKSVNTKDYYLRNGDGSKGTSD